MTTLLGFNLGIEVTQLAVVALLLPSLLLLSRTSVYPVLRVGVAALGAGLAAGWLTQRIGLMSVDPLEPVGNLLVDHPITLAVGLGVVAVTLAGVERARTTRAAPQLELDARVHPQTSDDAEPLVSSLPTAPC